MSFTIGPKAQAAMALSARLYAGVLAHQAACPKCQRVNREGFTQMCPEALRIADAAVIR